MLHFTHITIKFGKYFSNLQIYLNLVVLQFEFISSDYNLPPIIHMLLTVATVTNVNHNCLCTFIFMLVFARFICFTEEPLICSINW